MARIINQGSRLSAVRLAQSHAARDILNLRQGFSEDGLCRNLKWLADRRTEIEKRLLKFKNGDRPPDIFLYDVTSYLEGEHNSLADWGYNRDGKKGKKQLVVGLLCDKDGDPLVLQRVFAFLNFLFSHINLRVHGEVAFRSGQPHFQNLLTLYCFAQAVVVVTADGAYFLAASKRLSLLLSSKVAALIDSLSNSCVL